MAGNNAKHEATELLEAHEKSIDTLHKKLTALHGGDAARIDTAVKRYKEAHETFEDDVLGIVGSNS